MNDDDKKLLDLIDKALTITPLWDARRAELLRNKADVLRRRASRTGNAADDAIADEALRAAYQAALAYGGLTLYVSAGEWAAHCVTRGNWAEAVAAGEQAVTAAEDLVRQQTHIYDKRAVLRRTASLARLTASALRHIGKTHEAITLLERGQAIVLANDYFRPALVEDRLRRIGHTEQADTYAKAVEAVRRINADDADLRLAQRNLANLIGSLSDLEGLSDLLFRSTSPESLLAGAAAVYIAEGFALVINSSGVVTDVELPELTLDATRLHAIKFIDRAVAGGNPADLRKKTIKTTCEWLDRVVMKPLRPALAGYESIVLIPTGRLVGLPLHAAKSAITARIHTYLPAAIMGRSAIFYLDRKLTAVAIADPKRNDASNLQGTRKEAKSIQKSFAMTKTLVGKRVTKRNVEAVLSNADIVHFGCHGVSDPRDALESELLLSGSDSIRLRDLLASPSLLKQARLVVLSACQTYTVDRDLPGESLNLTTGIIAAGARAVIGSLWPVPDSATADLMYGLYEGIRNGVSPARALHEAQLALMGDPSTANPYYWGGFVYVGL